MRVSPEILLLSAAAIWGFAFVAQVTGMEHVGPFAFNTVRFALGALSLVPLALWLGARMGATAAAGMASRTDGGWFAAWRGAWVAAPFLFGGASLQQVGLLYTSASNAGFITGLYIILVPLVGIVLGQRPALAVWIGALLAVVGLYALSVRDGFTLSLGDSLQLAGAFCWAGHVLAIGHFSPRCDPLRLAIAQYTLCALASAGLSLFLEKTSVAGLLAAAPSLAYAGIMSVGVAFTLQIVGQARVPPAPAAVIISLEAVFAALGGWWLLDERLDLRGLGGCALMLCGMIVAQWPAAAGSQRPRSVAESTGGG